MFLPSCVLSYVSPDLVSVLETLSKVDTSLFHL